MYVEHEGYIKLWRRLHEWPLWSVLSWPQRGVLISILWAANWRDREEYVPGRGLSIVARGTLLCSQDELARYSDTSRQTVRSTLRHLTSGLDSFTFVTTQTLTNRCSLITVTNYETYQGDVEVQQPTGQPAPQPAPQPKNGPCLYSKNTNIHATRVTSSDVLSIAPEAWKMADLMRALLLQAQPGHSCGGKRWSKRNWARAFDAGQRTTGAEPLSWALIEAVLRWTITDSDDWADGRHWRDLINTPAKLFQRWDTLLRQYQHATAGTIETSTDASTWQWGQP